ncbi:MAG: hypothetical protein Q7U57_00305 [Methylovulum sp.]|nr:hypothetical protein [Methylovulum sp.]
MMTTIKLYGHLGKTFGREYQFDIDTVAEVISALSANIPGFKPYLIEHSEPGYRVIVDQHPLMSVDELGLCVSHPGTIKIVPVVVGAGDGKAIGQIFVGIALVAAALLTGGAAIGAAIGVSASVGSGIATAAVSLGISMIMGGVSSLLSPVPGSNNAKQANNYGFSNTQDTIVQGVRIPIGYGRMLCEGYPISVRLVVEND